MTRATAMKTLQLSLKDFRRLCILKGIYPREPRNRKKAQRGQSGIKTLYNKKDITFLLHEPIIWKFREQKVIGRKIGRAKAMNERHQAKKLISKPVMIKLDHIVKERYPTFVDALRDLDDCLTLCHLFSTFPSIRHVPRDQSILCRRLMLEFMQVVIYSKALRKVFISIKGYYFQVEFKGQLITWIMPHQFSFEPQSKEEVDFRIMSTFVQFYIVLLGFVNFRLYHQMNLFYPPKVKALRETEGTELVDKMALASERIAALNYPLKAAAKNPSTTEEATLDDFEMDENDPNKTERAYIEAQKLTRLKTLFNGMKVFLNREVPREPLVFVLRCFGAEVSWDKSLFVGATFDETDETITHQIVDRPHVEKQYISRYYVQPQWVFDSVNARELLPVEKYFIGCVLPPHLSPFVDEAKTEIYHPPEEKQLFGSEEKENGSEEMVEGNVDQLVQDEPLSVGKPLEEEPSAEISSPAKKLNARAKKRASIKNAAKTQDDSNNKEEKEESSDAEGEDTEPMSREMLREQMKQTMCVKPGRVQSADPIEEMKKEREEYKLREKMVHKKHRALYKSMMKGRALRARDVKVLEKKRALIDQKKLAAS